MSDETQKFFTSFLTVAEHAKHATRDRARTRLLNATHRHAHMLTLHHHGDTARLQCFVKRQCNLSRKALLHKETSRKSFSDTRELRKANHHTVGNIADVDLY